MLYISSDVNMYGKEEHTSTKIFILMMICSFQN